MTVLRLNPLTNSDIADILNARPDINDADAFIAAAEERGVEGLLANPQTLKMLADVVGPRRRVAEKSQRNFRDGLRSDWFASTTKSIKWHRSQTVHLHPIGFSTPPDVSVPFS